MTDKRQTGRTTRMLARAKQLAASGRAVYIIAANYAEAQRLVAALGGDRPSVSIGGIKVETPETCGNFDWLTLTLRGSHQNCVVLVDHHAIESRFAAVLQELHAYDQ
jgi:hypothetical protein